MSRTGLNFNMRLLMALRAGDATTFTLRERFGDNYSMALSFLRRNGFVRYLPSGEVSMTPLGREHCPSRRTKKVVT